ncbi:MAG: PEP-CTERM/exosortase system-associated acyltransferase [Rhodocyclaceae bacterium]|nr:PEP-CTERM/exosortase system-associated acyltransferase [Rhodocyclaceae bacterium]MBX3667662.1 PEP-CTERM/exosortase system-associated acyltransferase [Rhodocyclaceae bacterium]
MADVRHLGENFKKYFEVLPAFTPELKEATYRIRHSVYCEELGYESVRTEGVETDTYDPHSVHLLLRTISGMPVGCIRLVRPDPDEPHDLLPFEKTCAAVLDRARIDPAKTDRAHIAEVSRLAVLGSFRKRKGEANTPVALSDRDFGAPGMPRFPYIPVGLYTAMFLVAADIGLHTLFVLTEPRLARHLSALGIKLTQIGGPVQHRGTRIPSVLNTQENIDSIKFNLLPLFEVIEADVRRLGSA